MDIDSSKNNAGQVHLKKISIEQLTFRLFRIVVLCSKLCQKTLACPVDPDVLALDIPSSTVWVPVKQFFKTATPVVHIQPAVNGGWLNAGGPPIQLHHGGI